MSCAWGQFSLFLSKWSPATSPPRLIPYEQHLDFVLASLGFLGTAEGHRNHRTQSPQSLSDSWGRGWGPEDRSFIETSVQSLGKIINLWGEKQNLFSDDLQKPNYKCSVNTAGCEG